MRRRFERELPREVRDEMATVTVHQLESLHHLISSGGLTMNELAAKQCIGLSSATALADRLLRQGLAQRTSDPADRRIVRLVPTHAATELAQRFDFKGSKSSIELTAEPEYTASTFVGGPKRVPIRYRPRAGA